LLSAASITPELSFKNKEMKMPKMKTKSGAKKRFRVTAGGKVKFKNAFSRHMMMNKPKKMKRKTRGMTIVFQSEAEKVMTYWMPYSRRKKKRAPARKTETSKAETGKSKGGK
jgi:large subunit ribosomal protein L35